MAKRGQITGCLVDGPLALDNALSEEACRVKGITTPVGGDADILMAPEIVAANILYKSVTNLAGGRGAALVVGARCPCILTSRADDHETKMCSLILAIASAQGAKKP
jgi:phosphotransacetylase